MTNEKLKEIKERLLTENDNRRRLEQEQANACANYYERGVNDALTAVSFARPEQQNQPASGEWLKITLLRRAVSVKLNTKSQPRRKQKRAYGTRLCVLTATARTAALRWTEE